jgi:uncharacterized MAPEG superfamily protein
MIINATDTPLYIVTLFALWTALLAVIVPIWRISLVASGLYRVSDFTPGDAHGSALYWRINRAHANAVENLVVFAALAIAGIASGVSDPLFGTLCVIVMGARIAQSLIHIVSGSAAAVMARFVAFAVQAVSYFVMGFMILLHHAAA